VAAIVVFFVITSRTRCPKCKERIGHIEHGSRRRRVKSMIGLDYCRSCGLHLDAEIPDLKMEGGGS
jgi:transcription elongation factor Elf1